MKNTSNEEIEIFLFYAPEKAMQIVKELIGQKQEIKNLSVSDKEMRNLAVKIRESSHYKLYNGK